MKHDLPTRQNAPASGRCQTTPGASNLFRVAVLPNNALFAFDHGTIFLGQFSG